jgi:hypothetical protein
VDGTAWSTSCYVEAFEGNDESHDPNTSAPEETSRTDSIDSKRKALDWFTRCTKNEDREYDDFRTVHNDSLPTRLVDVEWAL